jgi:hypothetical protein
MEYFKVLVPGRENQDIEVLINTIRSGKVGEVLTMVEGYVLVSVDLPDAEEKAVELWDTSPSKPKVIEVRASAGPAEQS